MKQRCNILTTIYLIIKSRINNDVNQFIFFYNKIHYSIIVFLLKAIEETKWKLIVNHTK